MSANPVVHPIMRRVFRRHRLIKLYLPGLPWLTSIALISVAALRLAPYSSYALWLFVLAVLPLLKLLRLCLAWLGYSVTAVAGSGVLVERSGLLGYLERKVPITEFGTIECRKPWWAALFGLDVADVTVGAMGSPLVLRCIGDFSDLWTVLQSKGQTVPPRRAPPLIAFLKFLGRALSALSRLLFKGLHWAISGLIALGCLAIPVLARKFVHWAHILANHVRQARRSQMPSPDPGLSQSPTAPSPRGNGRHAAQAIAHRSAPGNGSTYQGEAFSPLTCSAPGFCAFCEQFVLADKNWTREHYGAQDLSRRYYRNGISDPVACFYLRTLKQACVLIPGPNGHSRERLSCRIRSIEDILCLIPGLSDSLNRAT
jgi:hypothetical protein